MENHSQKFKIRLGLFVAGGFAIFVIAIFIIGKQRNLFNPVFKLTTTFSNVSGLQVGNNVRFSGINVGSVDNIVLINDSTVRVDMLIRKDIWQFIKADCKVTIGSEGIIGDKLLIITQGGTDTTLAKEGQHLESLETIETNTIMARLDETTANAEIISRQISEITFDINEGHGTLSRIIKDPILAENLSQSIYNLNVFTKGLNGMDEIMKSLKVTATNAEVFSKQLTFIMNKINRSDSLMANLNSSAANIESISGELSQIMKEINNGNGTISRLIRDTIMATNLNKAIINLRSSSRGLDENMTAVKHNFLFRAYYERKAKIAEKKKQKIDEELKLVLESELKKVREEAQEQLKNDSNQ